jgi:hypothetical protein
MSMIEFHSGAFENAIKVGPCHIKPIVNSILGEE